MSFIQNFNKDLREVVSNISSGKYVIPKFQRDFVWNKPDISSLGDSIARGYPISSLLTMPKNGSLKVQSHSIRANGSTVSDDDCHYILDGQQRITSLAKIFLDMNSGESFYFDILYILIESFPEDKIEQNSFIKDQIGRPNSSKVDGSFCRSFRSSDSSDSKKDGRFISGHVIMNGKHPRIINKFVDQYFRYRDEETRDKYIDKLNVILGQIPSYSIPVTEINQNAEIDLVVRVFEKVNSSGKKLTVLDLVNAKTFGHKNDSDKKDWDKKDGDKGGVVDYWSKGIDNLVSQHEDINKDYVMDFFEKDRKINGSVYSDLTKLMHIIYVCNLIKSDKVPSVTKQGFMNESADFWFEEWDSNGYIIAKSISEFGKRGMLEFSKSNLISFFTALIASNQTLMRNSFFLSEVEKYSLSLSLLSEDFNKSNLGEFDKFVEYSKRIKNGEIKNQGFENYGTILQFSEIKLTKEDILNCRPVMSNKFKSIRYILKKAGYFSQDIMGNGFNDEMDDHHIIPKSLVINRDEAILFDSIANRMPLDKVHNRSDISNKEPSEYLNEIKRIRGDVQFSEFERTNLIEGFIDANTEDEWLKVLHERAEKIAVIVNNHFASDSSRQRNSNPTLF